MRTLGNYILVSRTEMTKKDYIETILFILRKILDYTSSLNQITPTLFDKKSYHNEKDDSDISTNASSKEDNSSNSLVDEEDIFTLVDYLYFWVDKLEFDENLLILTMMNIDKILSKEFVLTSSNVKNVLFTCMVITQKYYEDENFCDKDYSKIINLKANELINMEIEILSLMDFSLNITEDEFNNYKNRMKNVWKNNLSFFTFT